MEKSNQDDPNALGIEFKRRLKNGELILGVMVFEYLRPSLAKIFSKAGFDFIFLENEHANFDGHAKADFVLCARDNGTPVISKIPELSRTDVTRLLDAGVIGIQLPRTESREDLLTLIDYMKFHPLGTRAGAPCFGNVDYSWASVYEEGGRKWLREANDATVVVAQIETRKGYEKYYYHAAFGYALCWPL
jgi:2-keto-3-deoxy-L-rhamnonate aldolase RhmA